MSPRVFAAVDLGASSGRVIAGTVANDHVELREVHRFANGVVERDGHLRWDLRRIYREVLVGLERLPDAESVGIDSWGVDYGLLDGEGRLLADPISYRDDRTAKFVGTVHALVPPDELYAMTGIQFLAFNTIYQLAAEQQGPLWDRAARVALVADLVAYWLTGHLRSEVTLASTTGLLDIETREWSSELLSRLDLPEGLLPEIEGPGAVRGETTEGLAVVTVGSHDTASAVVSVPATTDRFAYICSGTWSLVGLELERPLLSLEARQANFTNEAGVDGRIRFLRNVGGLWLLQECLRSWRDAALGPLLAGAASLPPGGPQFNVDDPGLAQPGQMPRRIADAAGRHEMARHETVRCILDSLAFAYARTVVQACALADSAVDVIHLVGGGARNHLLCQLTADAAGLPVLAGPPEATALGNVAVQARARGALSGSLETLRAVVAESVPPRRYEPR